MKRLFNSLEYLLLTAIVWVLIFGVAASETNAQPANCAPANTTSVSDPLTELVNTPYERLTSHTPTYETTVYEGGLYPDSNTRPAAHYTAGLNAAGEITPLDSSGNADANGKIVFMSIGMSNTSQEFTSFIGRVNSQVIAGTIDIHPNLEIVNGALSGQDADDWIDENDNAWTNALNELSEAGVGPNQVQVIWMKMADQTPPDFPDDITDLASQIITISQLALERFPNTKMIYFSSRARSYLYFDPTKPGEPAAFQTGLAVKSVVEQYINGDLTDVPYLTWGPYFWEDDWPLNFLSDDCIHPSTKGRNEIAQRMIDYFTTDDTSVEWFTGTALGPTNTPTPTPTSGPTPTPTNTPTPTPTSAGGSSNTSTYSSSPSTLSDTSFIAITKFLISKITTGLQQLILAPTPTPETLLPETPDGNGDGVVDTGDYHQMFSDYGNKDCDTPSDLDGNCVVNIYDYYFLFNL